VQRSLTSSRQLIYPECELQERTLEMRRKLRVGAAMACLLLLGTVTVASATSSRGSRGSDWDDGKVVVLDVTGRIVKRTVPPPTDVRQGGQLTLTSDLFHKGTKVGEEHNVCTITRIEADGAVTLYCDGIDSLPGGQIAWQGAIRFGPNELVKADPYFLAISGGSGKYRTAHGEIRVQDLTTEEFRYSMRIIL